MNDLKLPYPEKDIRNFFLSIKDAYSNDIKHFIKYLDYDLEKEGGPKRESPLDLTFENVKRYALWSYRNSSVKTSTHNKRIVGIRNRLKDVFASECDIHRIYYLNKCLDELPLKKFADLHIGEEKLITQKEHEKLLKELPGDLKLICEYLNLTGNRISEMISITFENIKLYKDQVHIRIQGKRVKERIIRLEFDFFSKLLDFFHNGEIPSKSTHLFIKDGKAYERTCVTNRLKSISKRVLGRSIHPHMYRHKFGSEKCTQLPNRLDAIANYLGHKSKKTLLDAYVSQPPLSMKELYSHE
jgi:integrase